MVRASPLIFDHERRNFTFDIEQRKPFALGELRRPGGVETHPLLVDMPRRHRGNSGPEKLGDDGKERKRKPTGEEQPIYKGVGR